MNHCQGFWKPWVSSISPPWAEWVLICLRQENRFLSKLLFSVSVVHTFRIFNNKTFSLRIPRVLTLWRIFSLYFNFKFSSRNCSKLGESSKWPQFFSRSISAVRDLISFSCKGKGTFPVSSKVRSQDNGKLDQRLTSSFQFSTIYGLGGENGPSFWCQWFY